MHNNKWNICVAASEPHHSKIFVGLRMMSTKIFVSMRMVSPKRFVSLCMLSVKDLLAFAWCPQTDFGDLLALQILYVTEMSPHVY